MVLSSICKLWNVQFFATTFKIILLILIYYSFSITLTFYNKKYITIYPYPLSITVFHLLVKFIFAWICRIVWSACKKKPRIQLKWSLYLKRVAPTAIASSLDIGLSNWSFEFITVSLYTMTKSSSIIFILLFSILLKLEKRRSSLVFVILFIALGLFMFTYKSTQFDLDGFLLCFLASFISGLRWSSAQLVLQKQELGLHNPLDMIFHMQPFMMLSLLPLSASFESLEIAGTHQFFASADYAALSANLLVLMVGAVLAFFLEIAEYLVISRTSGLTLSIAAILKEICTLYLASKYNRDQMNFVNAIGMVVCLLGISLHVFFKALHHNPNLASWIRFRGLQLRFYSSSMLISSPASPSASSFTPPAASLYHSHHHHHPKYSYHHVPSRTS